MSSASLPSSFDPLAAVLGGLFIGVGTGIFMLVAHRIAGNSGALRAVVVGPRDGVKLAYCAGLVVAGVIMRAVLPENFEPPRAPSLGTFAWGVIAGIGTSLANGALCARSHP